MKVFFVLLVLSMIVAALARSPTRISGCQIQRKQNKGKKGEYVPRCEANGDYSPLQSRDGWYFCVDAKGNKLQGPVKTKPNCRR